LAIGVTAALVAVAVASKLAAGWLGARRLGPGSGLVVGVGMIPRGEVSLIVASTAVAAMAFPPELFAATVAVVVITSVATPPILGALIDRQRRREGRER
jgi:Kef-type K+ transport system membrane component KefB